MMVLVVIMIAIVVAFVLVMMFIVRMRMRLMRRCTGPCIAEQIRRDFAMPGGDDLRGGIDFAQADLEALPGRVVEPVGLV